MSFDTQTAPPNGTTHLQRNSIGLAHIVFFVVAAAAPLTAVVGASPVAFAFGNGAGVPGAFLLSGLLYIIFSAGFTTMSRHIGSTGGFYTYIAQGLGRPAGVAGAMMALLTYTAVQCAVYAMFGVFFQGAIAGLGLEAPWFVWSLIAMLLVHLAGQRNIAFSGKILAVAMTLEVLILLMLDIGIILQGGGPEGLTLTTFAPATVFSPGLGVALVFVIGSFIGFEATAIFGDEARDPHRTIPRATYVAVTLITAFYALSTWAIAVYYGPSNIQSVAQNGLETLFFTAAENVLGHWSVTMMNALLLLSLFACVLSFHNTLNRYFFALGREGIIAKTLGQAHPVYGSPSHAGYLQTATAAIILGTFILLGADPMRIVFSWMSGMAVLAVLAVQVMVSLAIIAYFRRVNTSEHPITMTLILPLIGLAGLVTVIALVLQNLRMLIGVDSPIVYLVPVIIAVAGIIGLLVATRIKRANPTLYDNLGSVFE